MRLGVFAAKERARKKYREGEEGLRGIEKR